MDRRVCSVCGREYIPTAYNQRRCPECVEARRMKCATCGAVYSANAYNRPGNRSHCPECLNKLRSANNTRALKSALPDIAAQYTITSTARRFTVA